MKGKSAPGRTPINVAGAFQPHQMPPKSLPVRCHVLNPDSASLLEDYLVRQIGNCYIDSQELRRRTEETGLSASAVLANKLPEPGSVMSGDFGEILTLFFLSSERPEVTHIIRKWRYKQDRLKPAPHSDVVILHRKDTRRASNTDFVICAEAKQKATRGAFDPITKAVEGFMADNTGRLARTLVWLREKAIDSDSRSAIEYLDRFTQASMVPYRKHYKAVAIVDRGLLDSEISRDLDLPEQNEDFEVIVLGVDNLYDMYNSVYQRATREVKVE